MPLIDVPRPGWDEWFLDGAKWASGRADCSRRQVGALVIKAQRVISQGYNGALPGERGCLAGGCPRAQSDVAPGSQYDHGPGACIAIHAELNALLDASYRGVSVQGATMYLTDEPCRTCYRLITRAGIVKVVWRDTAGKTQSSVTIPL